MSGPSAYGSPLAASPLHGRSSDRQARILLSAASMALTDEIEIHFSGMGLGGGTLVVVAIGTDVYGATAKEPVDALGIAARRAADDLALRGRPVDARVVIERGLGRLGEVRP